MDVYKTTKMAQWILGKSLNVVATLSDRWPQSETNRSLALATELCRDAAAPSTPCNISASSDNGVQKNKNASSWSDVNDSIDNERKYRWTYRQAHSSIYLHAFVHLPAALYYLFESQRSVSGYNCAKDQAQWPDVGCAVPCQSSQKVHDEEVAVHKLPCWWSIASVIDDSIAHSQWLQKEYPVQLQPQGLKLDKENYDCNECKWGQCENLYAI
mgnify:CR=1 FL=1